jgi:hypothetical protein
MSEIKSFRKKPVVIQAIRWDGEERTHINLIKNGFPNKRSKCFNSIVIDTLEGVMHCDIGDWIIKGVKGEFYPCKHDIFQLTYDEVC